MGRELTRRAMIVAAALMLGMAAILLQGVALPAPTLACRCVQPRPLVEYGVSGEHTVLIGTLGPAQGDITPITVERWFHGEQPADTVWVWTGTGNEASCDYRLVNGESRFLVLHGPIRGAFSTNICLPSAAIGTDEAARLIAEAEAAFGSADPPAPDTPSPRQPIDSAPLLGEGLMWIVGGIGLALLLFGGVMLVARRRPLS